MCSSLSLFVFVSEPNTLNPESQWRTHPHNCDPNGALVYIYMCIYYVILYRFNIYDIYIYDIYMIYIYIRMEKAQQILTYGNQSVTNR